MYMYNVISIYDFMLVLSNFFYILFPFSHIYLFCLHMSPFFPPILYFLFFFYVTYVYIYFSTFNSVCIYIFTYICIYIDFSSDVIEGSQTDTRMSHDIKQEY